VDYRSEHGPFRTIEDLLQVQGIGEGTFEKIKDYITVSD
jgi:competence protein ComEA